MLLPVVQTPETVLTVKKRLKALPMEAPSAQMEKIEEKRYVQRCYPFHRY